MKISAHNQFAGMAVAATPGAGNGTVRVNIDGGTGVTSSITEEAIAEPTGK